MKTRLGTVKWFSEGKGFGFITPDDGSKDLFAHFSEMQEGVMTLRHNQRVRFEVTRSDGARKLSAIRPA